MEVAQAFAFVRSTLLADSAWVSACAAGCWLDLADTGTTPPFTIVGKQTDNDVLTFNVKRLFSNILLQIKAVGPAWQSGDYDALVTIANRIEANFGRTGPIALSSGGVLQCYREGEIAYSEVIGGKAFSHLGGLYRLNLQGS